MRQVMSLIVCVLLGAAAHAATMKDVVGFEPRFVPPAGSGYVNIRTDFGAVGDGITDDTDAFTRAIETDQPRAIYIPAGTYLIRDSLVYGKNAGKKKRVMLVGESVSSTIIRLADNAPGFDDPGKPRPVIHTRPPTQQGEQNMHQYVMHLTIEVGRGNPGAIGLNYHTNNTGAVKDVAVRAADPGSPGLIGISCEDWEVGPGNLRYVSVDGFRTGISLTKIGNYMTLEHVTIHNADVGLRTATASVRRLATRDVKTPVEVNGQVVIIDSDLAGTGAAAIEVKQGALLARDIETSGTTHAIVSADARIDGPRIDEQTIGHTVAGAGVSSPRSLNLPVEESPELPYPAADGGTFIAGDRDVTSALQQAIDSGATDVMIGQNARITNTIVLRNQVRRLTGAGVITIRLETGEKPAFRLEDGAAPAVKIEQIYAAYGSDTKTTFEQASPRTLVIRHGSGVYRTAPQGRRGKLFMESFVGDISMTGVSAWLRDMNTEAGGPHALNIENAEGTAWILGHKTEDYAVKIRTIRGSTELLGGTYRQNWDQEDFARAGITQANRPPLFEIIDGHFSASYISWGPGLPFTTIVRESRSGTQTDHSRPAVGGGAVLFSTSQGPR